MRKIVIAAFAAVCLAIPAFAQEEDDSQSGKTKKAEVVLKLEVAPVAKIRGSGKISSATDPDLFTLNHKQYASNTGINAAVECYYYFFNFLGAGAGFKQAFSREIDNFGHISVSNVYLALKPKLKLKPATGSKCDEYVYLIAQGGYGFINDALEPKDAAGNVIPSDTENGLYYGLGAGFQLNNFIIEVIFSANEGKIKGKDYASGSMDIKYSSTNLNVGYRFGF